MGEDRLNASGFEFYEGIRIAIPGALTVALYVAIDATFGLGAPQPDLVLGIVVAVGVGLILYYTDISGSAQIYKAARPHRVLERWQLRLPSGISTLNAYFVLLDSVMPAGIRNRALYFGSIFRIGYEAIYLSALSAVAVITIATLTTSPMALRTTDHTVLWIAVGTHVAAALLGLLEGYNLARPRADDARAALRRVFRRLIMQVGWSGLAFLVAATALVVAHIVLDDWAPLLAGAVALTAFLWASRYWYGYRQKLGERRNVDPATSSLLLAVTIILATVIAAVELPSRSVMGTAAALGWSGMALTAELMLALRGHERKLWAAYHTQRVWFELNKETVTRMLTSTPPAADPPLE